MALLAAETGILNNQLCGYAFLEASDINDTLYYQRGLKLYQVTAKSQD